MKVAADTTQHQNHLKELVKSEAPMTKMDSHDPRLIRFGSLLRATGLDELPQLINVFKGEMSLVGPRPCIPYEYEMYEEGQKKRFNTLPGLTGLWQVSGKNKTTFSEMIQMDVHYARNMSLFMDIGIIVRTLPVVAGQALDCIKNRLARSRKSNIGNPKTVADLS